MLGDDTIFKVYPNVTPKTLIMASQMSGTPLLGGRAAAGC